MTKKIAVQHVFQRDISAKTQRYEELWEALDDYALSFGPAEYRYTPCFLADGSGDVYSPLAKMENDVRVARSAIGAGKDGADAITVACFADPAVEVIRGLVDVPVVGAGEASFVLASTWGHRVGIVVVAPPVVPQVEANLHRQGQGRWLDRLQRPRTLERWDYDVLVRAMRRESLELIDLFQEQAKRCVRDGADVVIAGCAYLGAALSTNGIYSVEGCDVPVIDSFGAGLYLAAAQAGIRKAPWSAEHRAPRQASTV